MYVLYKTTGDCFCYNERNSWTSHTASAKLFSLYETVALVIVMCVKHEHDVRSMCILEIDDLRFIDFFDPVWDGSKLPFSHLYNMLDGDEKNELILDVAAALHTMDYSKVKHLIANFDGAAPDG